ncbi:MAG TPA: Sapep family Mn(2+)-dependent dipeptidase, partial [Synergistetes bacterium]|nr:Sapep family Mn(2+)-dependent dipeptidase [Synergistota bacterium]
MESDVMLKKFRPDIISNLQEMIRIRSVEAPPLEGKPFGDGVDQALRLALETSSSLGLRAVNRNGMIGYAEYGSGKEMVAVLAHLDVVPEGKGWTYPPFGAEIHDGRIYGRGTTDDKGPAVAAIWALKFLADENHRLSKRIRIIFGTNEESGFRGIKWYAENEEIPVAGFTPDIHEGIVFAEKGALHIQMDIQVNQGDKIVLDDFRSGEAVNIVPDLAEAVFAGEASELDKWAQTLEREKGSLSLGGEVIREEDRLIVRAKGKAAHASLPEKGLNAIAELCHLLGRSPHPGVFNTLSKLFLDPAFGKELGIE